MKSHSKKIFAIASIILISCLFIGAVVEAQRTIGRLRKVDAGQWSDGIETYYFPTTTESGAISVTNITASDLTASRLTASDGNKKIVSVADLASWIAGTSGEITVTSDGDGTVTLSIPLPLQLNAGTTSYAPLVFQSGPLLTTPAAGTLEFYGSKLYLTNIGKRRAIDRTSDVITSTTTVSDTAAETTIFTAAIGANDLIAGNLIKIHTDGIITNATEADDITVKWYIGTTELGSFATAIGNVTGAPWDVDFTITIRSTGETGSAAWHSKANISTFETEEIGIEVVDTTIAENITVTVQWANAKAGNTISIYQGYMEIKN